MKKGLWKVHHDKASLAVEIEPPLMELDLSVSKNKTDLQLQVNPAHWLELLAVVADLVRLHSHQLLYYRT